MPDAAGTAPTRRRGGPGWWPGCRLPPPRSTCRRFVAVPGRDRIVPPESARPLADLVRGAVLHAPAAGHIGMAAGSGAEAALWRPLLEWLRGL